MDLKLRTHKTGGATVVEVAGEVELHSAGELRDELQRAGEGERPCVVVDLSRVSFIDSTGLGVLVGAFKRVRERGSLSIVCPQRSIRRVFEITGLMQVFPFHQNLDEAVRSCSVVVGASPLGSEHAVPTTSRIGASSTGLHSALSAMSSVMSREPASPTQASPASASPTSASPTSTSPASASPAPVEEER